jgi:hypothetical protein
MTQLSRSALTMTQLRRRAEKAGAGHYMQWFVRRDWGLGRKRYLMEIRSDHRDIMASAIEGALSAIDRKANQ